MKSRVALLSVCGIAASAWAQSAPMRSERVQIGVDSGLLSAPDSGSAVVFSEEIEAPGGDWIRLWFGPTMLPEGAILVITSPISGHQQTLNATTLAQWSDSSAYFEGDRVFVDLILDSRAGEGRVVIDAADMGLPAIDERTICDGADLRVLSNDPRAARLAPQGCTTWLFNNRANTLATAAHCGASGTSVVWFNVPLRTSGGTAVPPAPEDQYAIDGTSVQSVGSWSIGNDWATFGVFSNANTGLSPVDAQKASYVLATSAPTGDGRPITITGYGTVSSPIPPSWGSVQKTHTGPYYSESGTTIRYRTDTTGGNSGSAVFDENEQRVIGIHTNGGCGSSSSSSNSGTSVENAGFRNALMLPRGVAAGPVPAVIRPLDELPGRVAPDGSTSVGIELVPDFTSPGPVSGATLHTNDGSGWASTPMNAGFAGDWFAAFPEANCGSTVRYYFSAVGTGGATVRFPPAAPAVTFDAIASDDWIMVEDENFEATGGWTVQNTNVTSGPWERGVPNATDSRGGPRRDADGSGACWTTGLALFSDLTGGPTRVLSPVYDLSGLPDAWVDVALWLNADGTTERLNVEFSSDGGTTWILAEAARPTPGWRHASYKIRDVVALNSQFRARFSVSDLGSNDVIEAGIDAFRIRAVSCPGSCAAADLAEPFGVLDLADIQAFVTAFNGMLPAADLAPPFGVWDLSDVAAFSGSFTEGCN
jgi:V8-like Glu-specific endopeptidase